MNRPSWYAPLSTPGQAPFTALSNARGSAPRRCGTFIDAVMAALKQLEQSPAWSGPVPKCLSITNAAGRLVFWAERHADWTHEFSKRVLKRASRAGLGV